MVFLILHCAPRPTTVGGPLKREQLFPLIFFTECYRLSLWMLTGVLFLHLYHYSSWLWWVVRTPCKPGDVLFGSCCQKSAPMRNVKNTQVILWSRLTTLIIACRFYALRLFIKRDKRVWGSLGHFLHFVQFCWFYFGCFKSVQFVVLCSNLCFLVFLYFFLK